MDQARPTPSVNQISILSAAILLAYTLSSFILIPSRTFSLQLPGLFLQFQIDERTIISLLIVVITAAGVDSLIREHPEFTGKGTVQHWLLPVLTAWGIGLVLFQEPFSIIWWLIFAVGGTALILVLFAEFIVIDPNDVRYHPATIGLIVLSFTLFLILAITIRAIEVRTFVLIPAISIAAGLISLRTIHLLQNQWAFIHSLVIAMILGQMSAALNYVPVEPITFALILLAPTYSLTIFAGGLLEKKEIHRIILEPVLVLIIVWTLAFILR
jgi:hypothetical protein